MSEEAAHPRNAIDLQRIEEPARAFEHAMSVGRLHHAWLLTGPKGVGKASFAYRAARGLLDPRPPAGPHPLGGAPGDQVARLVAARAHPDLLVLELGGDDGKPRTSISVDEARRLPAFFAKGPAVAPFRVAIIDAVDDMNANAENAILKTLEEPSGRGVLLLVSHAPGRLLPTVRSRCRRLAFALWPETAVSEFAQTRLEIGRDEAVRLARMALGAPGRALTLHAAGALEADAAARGLLAALPHVDAPALVKLTDGFRGAEGGKRFSLMLECLADGIRSGSVSLSGVAADRWSRAWERLSQLRAQVSGANLDRTDAFCALVSELRAAAELQPLPC